MENKMTSNRFPLLKNLSSVVFLVLSVAVFGQEQQDNAAREAERYLKEAEEAIHDEDFQSAEALYRQAIAKDPSNTTARYNLGNLYYNEEIPKDAVERHSQAAELATEKTMKHRSFHNQGNAYMKQENYPDAIEAYKNALRNNPEDDETRYNLALAKKMLEQEGGGGDGGQDQENEDQESENQDDSGDKGEKDQRKEGDQENKDQQEGEGEEDDQGQPENDQQKEQEGKNPEETNQPEQQQPIPGQLTPQQIQNLLEAMGNEEKKVQDKINAEKAKGAKTRSEKDW